MLVRTAFHMGKLVLWHSLKLWFINLNWEANGRQHYPPVQHCLNGFWPLLPHLRAKPPRNRRRPLLIHNFWHEAHIRVFPVVGHTYYDFMHVEALDGGHPNLSHITSNGFIQHAVSDPPVRSPSPSTSLP